MNEIQILENPEFGKIRIIVIDNEPWFVGKDVAEVLGYVAERNAIANHVDDDDKLTHKISAAGQMRKVTLINESGVYSLILSSKLPNAKKFKRWVTSDILPNIHKYGAYMTSEVIEKTLSNPDFIIQLATQLKNEKEARAKAEKKIEADAPKVLFSDTVSGSETSINVSELAKLIKQSGKVDIGRDRLFAWLREHKYLAKKSNEPTQKSMDLKVMEIKESNIVSKGVTFIARTPMITGKGQVYFINKIIDEYTKSNNVGLQSRLDL